MARIRGIKPELNALDKGKFLAYFCHPGRVRSELDSFAQKFNLMILIGGQCGVRKYLPDAAKSSCSSELPSNRLSSTSDGERSAIALLYFFQQQKFTAMHADANSGADVMLGPTLARYVDATFAHKKADEFIVKRVKFHTPNHTVLEV